MAQEPHSPEKTRKNAPTGEGHKNELTEEHIRVRAHAIWIEEGRPHGRDFEHWLQARFELEPEPAPKAEAKPEPSHTPETKAQAAPKSKPKAEPKSGAKVEAKTKPKPKAK
jgi:hypothetical protein